MTLIEKFEKPDYKQNRIEIVTLTPIFLGQCNQCEIVMNAFGANHTRRQLDEYPKEIIDQSLQLTEFIRAITATTFAEVRIIEALTIRGLIKLIRHKNGRIPLIIINGKKISSGLSYSVPQLVEKASKIIN